MEVLGPAEVSQIYQVLNLRFIESIFTMTYSRTPASIRAATWAMLHLKAGKYGLSILS